MAVYKLRINGTERRVDAAADRTLLSILREDLDLTGAKYGCGEGQCGACTVLLDGQAVRACLTKVSSIGARAITTIEGLEKDGKLHRVQEAFLTKAAFQCGFCTPGMILGAVALLDKQPKASEVEIRRALEGHICRCGTYSRIVQAVRLAGGARG